MLDLAGRELLAALVGFIRHVSDDGLVVIRCYARCRLSMCLAFSSFHLRLTCHIAIQNAPIGQSRLGFCLDPLVSIFESPQTKSGRSKNFGSCILVLLSSSYRAQPYCAGAESSCQYLSHNHPIEPGVNIWFSIDSYMRIPRLIQLSLNFLHLLSIELVRPFQMLSPPPTLSVELIVACAILIRTLPPAFLNLLAFLHITECLLLLFVLLALFRIQWRYYFGVEPYSPQTGLRTSELCGQSLPGPSPLARRAAPALLDTLRFTVTGYRGFMVIVVFGFLSLCVVSASKFCTAPSSSSECEPGPA
ncbi:hypothetical protein KC363_g50 [Hortaea werneckii]|nr:hypothetical protein KC363_g50 [Hortaea werneckii]